MSNQDKAIYSKTNAEEEPPSQSTLTTPTKGYDRKRQNRKGKGASNKSTEKFRLKQNQKTQKAVDDDIEEIKRKLLLDVEKAFGSRLPPTLTKPAVVLPINTWKLPAICDQVLTVLETAGKISFAENRPNVLGRERAFKCLLAVSAAQLESKLFFSRVGSPYRKPWEYGADYHRRMEYFASAYPRNFSPISSYIEQIGKFKLNGQEFVPWGGEDDSYTQNMCTVRSLELLGTAVEIPPRVVEVLPFMINRQREVSPGGDCHATGSRDLQGRTMFVRILDREGLRGMGMLDENGIINNAILLLPSNQYFEFVPADMEGFPPFKFDECIDDYVLLQHQVARKFRLAMPEVEIRSGIGTASQLSASDTVERQGFVRAWAPRDIGTDQLAVGAIFSFAPDTDDRKYSIYSHQVAAIEAEVQISGAINTFVDSIHGDFVSHQ